MEWLGVTGPVEYVSPCGLHTAHCTAVTDSAVLPTTHQTRHTVRHPQHHPGTSKTKTSPEKYVLTSIHDYSTTLKTFTPYRGILNKLNVNTQL